LELKAIEFSSAVHKIIADGGVDEAGMSTAAPDKRAVLCG